MNKTAQRKLQDAWSDGTPRDGLKALAEAIDELADDVDDLRAMREDQSDLSGEISDNESRLHRALDALHALDDELDGVKASVSGLRSDLDERSKWLNELADRLDDAEQEIVGRPLQDNTPTLEQFDELERIVTEKVEQVADQLDGLSTKAYEQLPSRADEVEQRVHDNEKVLGDILQALEEEGLLGQPVPAGHGDAPDEGPDEPEDEGDDGDTIGALARQAERRPIDLGLHELRDVVADAYPDADVLGGTGSGHPDHSFYGALARIDGARYRISRDLLVARDHSHEVNSGSSFLERDEHAKTVERALRDYWNDD